MRLRISVGIGLVTGLVWGLPATAGMPVSDIEDVVEGTGENPNKTIALAAGDFNDDGLDELVGAVERSNAENGVGVIEGKADGWGHVVLGNDTAAVHFTSVQINDGLGSSLGVGDIDDDGVDDLLVGAPGGTVIQGEVMVLFGGDFPALWEPQVENETYHKLRGGGLASHFGHRVASGADVTGDGIDDIAVCAPRANDQWTNEVGGLFIYEGHIDWGAYDGNQAEPALTFYGEAALCSSLLIAEDPLGGAGAGIIVGDAEAEQGRGVVYLVRPQDVMINVAEIAAEAEVIITGDMIGDAFGATVAALNGLDIGTNAPELVVGAPGHDGARGVVYIFDVPEIGATNFDCNAAQARIWGSWGNGALGSGLTAGKGFAAGGGTIWAGAPGANPVGPQGGAVAVLNGPTLEALGGEVWTEDMPGLIVGDHADGHLGTHLVWGDFDGDGEPDVAMAEPDYFQGSTYVLRSATLTDEDTDSWPAPLADCNDEAEWIHPFAPEECDGEDSDCDGDLPEDEWDEDLDAWWPCDGDCNDNDEHINPDAEEICDDGEDNDCDELWDLDDPDCDKPGDDDDGDDDGGDDDGGDDDGYASGFLCECHHTGRLDGSSAIVAALLLAVALIRRRT